MVRELGLEYLSLPVAPETINRQTVAQFNQIVDSAERPLFVHDSTGSRTGAMWYIRRITIDRVPSQTARRETASLGLSTSDTELWLRIQRVLAEQGREETEEVLEEIQGASRTPKQIQCWVR